MHDLVPVDRAFHLVRKYRATVEEFEYLNEQSSLYIGPSHLYPPVRDSKYPLYVHPNHIKAPCCKHVGTALEGM